MCNVQLNFLRNPVFTNIKMGVVRVPCPGLTVISVDSELIFRDTLDLCIQLPCFPKVTDKSSICETHVNS